MKGLLLFAIIASATLATGSAESETEFPGLINIFDKILVGDFGSCTGFCIAPNTKELMSTFSQLDCNATITGIARDLGGVRSFEDFYNVGIKRQASGHSKMCDWMNLIVRDCVSPLVGKFCPEGIVDALHEFINDIRPYICSTNPPVMECILSPAVIENITNFQGCVQPLVDKYSPYFMGEFNSTDAFFDKMREFYYNEIGPNDGQKIYNSLDDLAGCVSDKIGKVSLSNSENCASVKKFIDDEVDKIIAYLKERDILSCGMNTTLWEGVMNCGLDVGRKMSQDPKFQGQPDPFSSLANGDFGMFKKYYYDLKKCVLDETKKTCGKKWTYNWLEKQLGVLDSLVESNGKNTPQSCLKFNAASKLSNTKMMLSTVAFAVVVGVAFTL